MFACCHYYFSLPSSLIFIHTTCISLSLRRTSAPIHLTSVLGVLGTQETSYILIAGLLERDIFDLYFPEFDKPWVIHLRETCCCSTNLCTWRPNTVYKSRSIRRNHSPASQPDTPSFSSFSLTDRWTPPVSTKSAVSFLSFFFFPSSPRHRTRAGHAVFNPVIPFLPCSPGTLYKFASSSST